MKRIVFFSTPAYGHILAEEPIINSLVKNGYSVDWYCTRKFQKIVERSGAKFKEYKSNFDAMYDLADSTSDFYVLMQTILKTSRICFLDYEPEMKKNKPDLILYDSMCAFAKNISQKLGIKHVCLCTTFAYNIFTVVFSNMLMATIKLFLANPISIIKMLLDERHFRKENGIKRLGPIDLFVSSGDATIVLTLESLQPFRKTFPSSFHFVGTTIRDKKCIKQKSYVDEYDIYISAGSIFTETPSLIKEISSTKYFKDKKIIVNSSDGSVTTGRIKTEEYTDQLALLEKCNLFVNHGGINSIYDSIYRGVPQVCIPRQEEQRMNAKVITRKKAGFYARNFDICNMTKYEAKIKKFNENIAKYKEQILQENGTQNATKIILKLLEKG